MFRKSEEILKFCGVISVDEFVAGAADAEDVLRLGWIVLDFLSDVGDVAVHSSGGHRNIILPPDSVQEFIP